METNPNITLSETTTQPEPTPFKRRINPAQLPLVRLFKLVKKIAHDDDIILIEAGAIHSAMCELDSIGEFAWSILHRNRPNESANIAELYSEYIEFCVSKKWQPHHRLRFERIMRLETRKLRAH